MVPTSQSPKHLPFDGLVVCVSEFADEWYLSKMREMIENGGGRLADDVDEHTTHLIVPESTTRELANRSPKIQRALDVMAKSRSRAHGHPFTAPSSRAVDIWIVYDTWVWMCKKNERRENEAPYDAAATDRPKTVPTGRISVPEPVMLQSFNDTWRVYNFLEKQSAEAEAFHASLTEALRTATGTNRAMVEKELNLGE